MEAPSVERPKPQKGKERVPVLDERMKAYFRQHEGYARQAVWLERHLLKRADDLPIPDPENEMSYTPEHSEAQEKLRELVDAAKEGGGIPEDRYEVSRVYTEAIYSYYKQCAFAQREERGMRKFFNLSSTESLDVAGIRFFECMTKKPPVGRISFFRKEGYFVFSCEKESDYAALDENSSVKRIGKESLGSHHDRRFLRGREGERSESFQVTLIRINEEAAFVERIPSVLIHERQHFINHQVLKVFEYIEKRKKGLHQGAGRLHGQFGYQERESILLLKDEALATLRGGDVYPEDFSNQIIYGYGSFYRGLKAEDQKTIKSCFVNIGKQLAKSPFWRFKKEKDVLAMLVYQLMDIPLLDWPYWLSRQTAFYEERLREATALMPHLPPSPVPANVILPAPLRSLFDRVEAGRKELEQMRTSIQVAALGVGDRIKETDIELELKRLTEIFQAKYEHTKQDLDALQRLCSDKAWSRATRPALSPHTETWPIPYRQVGEKISTLLLTPGWSHAQLYADIGYATLGNQPESSVHDLEYEWQRELQLFGAQRVSIRGLVVDRSGIEFTATIVFTSKPPLEMRCHVSA